MRPTGTVNFTKRDDGTLSYQWSGGRRIAIARFFYDSMERARRDPIGSVVSTGPLKLRIVGIGFEETGSAYRSDVIAMREGLLARFVAWYARTAYRLAEPLFRFESKVVGRPLGDGIDIPKWSLTGIMLRPLL